MDQKKADIRASPDSPTWESDLTFRNDIDSPQEPRFTFSTSQDATTDQPLTFSHDIVNGAPSVDRSRPHQSRHSNDLYQTEKLEPLPRSATGISSTFGSLRNNFTVSPTRSPVAHFIRDWWLELLSCLFLLAALIAIIITAHEYQDHPLPNLPSGISINSILAIFNVILKAAMLLVLAQGLSHLKWTWFQSPRPLSDLAVYDNASRGPLGSIWLMTRLRGRDLVSTVGALLTVAAVILDPMAQQVIRYYSCQRVEPALTATLPRTNSYTETGAHAGAGINTVPQSLQSAINGGIFVPGAQVTPVCTTGNCTFPAISHTVGMRSVCSDVSSELVFSNVTIGTYETLNATLPSGLFTSYNPYSTNVTLMTMAFNASYGTFEIIIGPRGSDPQNPRNLCATSTDVEEPLAPDAGWQCRGWGAARCQFSSVIYTISNASIGAGRLTEVMTFAADLNSTSAGFSSNSYVLADLSGLSASQITSLRDAGYQIDTPAQPWLAYNVSVGYDGELTAADTTATSNTTRDIIPKSSIYQISSVATNSLFTFLADYLSGSIVPYGTRWTGSTVSQQIFNDYGANFTTVDSIMTNITNSITTHMRQHGSQNNSVPAPGQVWNTETCIRVRWAYVAFPASLTGLTIIFFVAMVLITSRAQQGVHHDFKSSPLALLFHGLDEDATRRVEIGRGGESNEVGELRQEASSMWVRLSPTDKGWRFVADDPDRLVR